jgi:hypothetical protein
MPCDWLPTKQGAQLDVPTEDAITQFRDAVKPSQASPAITMQAIQLAHTGTENVVPTLIGHPPIARTSCSAAKMAKTDAARNA